MDSEEADRRLLGLRWRQWLQGGAVSTAMLASLPADPARAQETVPAHYSDYVNVGLSVGVALGPTPKIAYGVDVRLRMDHALPFLRLEGRGLSGLRLVGGAQVPAGDTWFGELGLALCSPHTADGIGWGLGAHAAAGGWRERLSLTFAGAGIVLGDRRNFDASLAMTFVPTHDQGPAPPVPGRLLRAEGGFILPRVIPMGDVRGWRHALHAAELAAIAAERIEAARLEYASIWAFARMAAELVAVGAPAILVEQARAAAADERRHTHLCLALSGADVGLAPLPVAAAAARFAGRSEAALALLGREAWRDGCLGEGVAAAAAEQAAAGARCETVAAAERSIARDERAHAELAWQVLAWLWREGGGRVQDAMAASVASGQGGDGAVPTADLDVDYLAAEGVAPAEALGRSGAEVRDRAQVRVRALMSGA